MLARRPEKVTWAGIAVQKIDRGDIADPMAIDRRRIELIVNNRACDTAEAAAKLGVRP
jgi:hypothetical protein